MEYYFDHNATSPIREEAFQVLSNSEYRYIANPSSPHRYGRKAFQYLEDARDLIAYILRVPATTIFFNSGGTEANNTILHHFLLNTKKKIVIAFGSHPSVTNYVTAPCFASEQCLFIPLNQDGVIDIACFEKVLDEEEVGLISIPWAQNETGVVQPIKQVAEIARKKGIPLHLDGAQILGRIPVNLAETTADFITFTGHKFGAPRGIGFLYIPDQGKLEPMISGGFQENGMRAGTEDVLLAIALAKSLEAVSVEIKANQIKWQNWRRKILSALNANKINYFPIGENQPRIENTISLIFPGINTPILLMNLDMDGIAVATGSACSTGAATGAKVVEDMGYKSAWKFSLLRISFGWTNTEEEIRYLCNKLIYQILKK